MSRRHTTRTAEPPEPTEAEVVEQLQADIGKVLTDLGNLAVDVDRLTHAGQRRLGFLTPAAQDMLDDLTRKERRDRADAQRNGRPTGSGDVATPGNFAGIAAAAALWAIVQGHIRDCSTHLKKRGVCSLHRLRNPSGASPADLLWLLRLLVWDVTDPKLLKSILGDLTDVEETTQRFVDAVESSTPLGSPCPWCKRRTLVARFHEDLIRCERDPRTGHYEPCVCNDPICHCKTDPTKPRHQWTRPADPDKPDPKSPRDWHGLNRLLNPNTTTKGRRP